VNKIGGVFWTKFEHFLSKMTNDSLRPALACLPVGMASDGSFFGGFGVRANFIGALP